MRAGINIDVGRHRGPGGPTAGAVKIHGGRNDCTIDLHLCGTIA
jgi:hypothetical protein